jgi:hypothetical protein
VALVTTEVSEELSFSIVSVTRISELAATLAVTSNRRRVRHRRGKFKSSKVSVIYKILERLLLVTTEAVPNSPILVTLMMEALLFPETSVLIRVTRRNMQKMALFIVCNLRVQWPLELPQLLLSVSMFHRTPEHFFCLL